MNNQIQIENPIEEVKIEKPKFDRKKYMKEYMNEYFKKHKIQCDCGALVFPHAQKQHNASIKHKFIMLSKEV